MKSIPCYTIRRTDCQTGWQVLDPKGRVVFTTKRHESALGVQRALNESEC